MKFDLNKKVALITGASRGIGSAIARLFAESGALVVVHYQKNSSMAEKTLHELKGDSHMVYQADIADPGAVENMVNEVIKKKGGIDILVNNAGIYEEIPLTDLSYNEWLNKWRRTIDINLIGAANTSFCAAKHMINHGGGKIINITSRGAFRGEPEASYYGASKAGLNSLSQSMAKALAPYNISVFAVAPGFVNTDMVTHIMESELGDEIRAQSPLNRIAEPEEIANLTAFLASEKTEYLTGSIIDINGASYLRM
jgi:NAD(P)-dependent dehydrogenase (short-subunit alcohol dehydrogenase family)